MSLTPLEMMMRIKQPISMKVSVIWSLVGVFTLLALYDWISLRQHHRNPSDTTVPNFQQMLDGFHEITKIRDNPLKAAFGVSDTTEKSYLDRLRTTMLYRDFTATYVRLFYGMAAACLMSVFLGILMGCFEWLESLLLPILSFFAKVPGSAMIPVFFILVDVGELFFVTMIAFGVLPTLTQAIYLSAKHDLHSEEINKAYTLGASSTEVIMKVVYPQILPKILETIRLQIGPAMVYLLASEMLYGSVGLGYQIRMQQKLQNMATVYNYIIILGVIGLFLDHGMLLVRRRLCPWYSRFR